MSKTQAPSISYVQTESGGPLVGMNFSIQELETKFNEIEKTLKKSNECFKEIRVHFGIISGQKENKSITCKCCGAKLKSQTYYIKHLEEAHVQK